MTKLSQIWREKILEPFEELQERARQQWLTLAPRERLIVSVLASTMVLLLSILIIKEAFTFFSHHENQVSESLINIGEIQALASELSKQRSDLVRYERLRNRRDKDFKLTTFLESEAQKFSVVIDKMNPTKARTTEKDPSEDWVELKLGSNSNLDSVLKFFQGVEEPLGLRVVELAIKPQFTDPTKLEVTATIAAKKEI